VAQRTPFIGPRPFTETDAEVFFGRNAELAALVAEVVSTQIVLLYAPSGSGKSSLLGAGLIPNMRDDGFSVSRVRVNTLPSNVMHTPVDLLTQAIPASAAESTTGDPSLIILDQFEELLVAARYVELQALAETVYRTMAEHPLARIVISFREEYLARIGALFHKSAEVSTGHFHLDRLSRQGAREAFERSLATVGFRVDPEAADLFLDQLSPPTQRYRSEVGFEPLYLQLLGTQLWSSIAHRASMRASQDDAETALPDCVVTVADVRGLVDFDQAIEMFFNSTISQVCVSHDVTEKTMRDWIDRELVTADETRSMVRRQANETEGLPTSALDNLVEHGLLRTEPRGDDLWLELAHDQLVERVREFNRIWWSRRVHTLLLERRSRLVIANAASQPDLQRWMVSRSMLWNFVNVVRDTGLRLSRWYGRRVPFGRKRPHEELDRLALRAYVLTGQLIYTAIMLYRSRTRSRVTAISGIEGLDADAAKRRLHATALNLGRTEQLLAALNVFVTLQWVRALARLLMPSASGDSSPGWRRRRTVALFFSGDLVLTCCRWAVRNGLIYHCLNPGGELRRWAGVLDAQAGTARRCMSLEDAAAWSRDRPVLLVLDWRGGVEGSRGFQRFEDQELPRYQSAVRARGAIVAWCCRADVLRRGWRDGILGIGFPARGQRTYYIVERGSVTAWRTVRPFEFPLPLRFESDADPVNAIQPSGADMQIETRFPTILTALILASEAVPGLWREQAERYFAIVLGPLRRADT
jgi:hypothetical protein